MTFRIGDRSVNSPTHSAERKHRRSEPQARGWKQGLRRFKPKTLFTRTLIMIMMPLLLVQLVVAVAFYG
ncbi:MAG: hypothetical protein ORO03_03405, partial [Alphaproteobacteria bacterium]|nr:hypothetical protein [Alphaproteobacteria bacterium]